MLEATLGPSLSGQYAVVVPVKQDLLCFALVPKPCLPRLWMGRRKRCKCARSGPPKQTEPFQKHPLECGPARSCVSKTLRRSARDGEDFFANHLVQDVCLAHTSIADAKQIDLRTCVQVSVYTCEHLHLSTCI